MCMLKVDENHITRASKHSERQKNHNWIGLRRLDGFLFEEK